MVKNISIPSRPDQTEPLEPTEKAPARNVEIFDEALRQWQLADLKERGNANNFDCETLAGTLHPESPEVRAALLAKLAPATRFKVMKILATTDRLATTASSLGTLAKIRAQVELMYRSKQETLCPDTKL